MEPEAEASDAEFYRLREKHQRGEHDECPTAYCQPGWRTYSPDSGDQR